LFCVLMEKDKFISYIQFEKRYSLHTVNAYRIDLEQFYNFLETHYGIASITGVNHMIIRSWTVDLMEQKVSARSVNRKLSTLKSFFNFLLREGIVDHNPMRKITSPRTSKRLPVFIEKEKMDTLLDVIDFGEGFPSYRDRIIIEMLYNTGMRLAELINIKETDIDFHHSTIKVLGKRNKERLIPFSDKFKSLLKNYLSQKAIFLVQPQNFAAPSMQTQNFASQSKNYFFITNRGRQLYPKFVYRIVTTYLGQITTLTKRSPHVLRHTFATHLLNNGAELNAVKELLGHATLSATQVYTHNTIEKLKRIYHQAHPKA
jgi:integrase/recombinase XerC